MSYDLYALRVPAGMTAEQAYEAEDDDVDEAPPTAAERAEMERLAEALVAIDPLVERHDGGDYIEIDTPSMQVSVYARSAGISVPYWFEGGEADRVMTRAFEYAAVLAEVGGYAVYDPQTGDTVAGVAPEDAKRIYADTTVALQRSLAERAEPQDAPRWKFWKRR